MRISAPDSQPEMTALEPPAAAAPQDGRSKPNQALLAREAGPVGELQADESAAEGAAVQPAVTGKGLPRSTSGAVLAASMPYPEKFHVAAKLAGAPEHEAAGLDDAERLLLYALYRQAVDGPCAETRPSIFDPTESAKYMAYNRLSGMNTLEVSRSDPSQVICHSTV